MSSSALVRAEVPAASSRSGLVCSIDRLASEAGVEMMRSGGNAVDAAIAANAVLAVIAPYACGMGGDLFALVQVGGEAPSALNSSGRAPSGVSARRLIDEGRTEIPQRGHPAAVTLPGCVDGWLALHERYGSLPLGDVLRPAHEMAADGFPAGGALASAAGDVAEVSGNVDIPPDLRPGQRVRRPGSARALEAVKTDGREGFYEGEFGDALLALDADHFHPEDLRRPAAEWVEPIEAEAWGHRIWTVPPNSQGYLILAAAAVAQHLPLPVDPEEPDWAYWLIEAACAVGASRREELFEGADPAVLLAPDRLEALAHRILAGGDGDGADGFVRSSAPLGDTTYLCAADDRCVVSLIQSNAQGFGSHLVAGETGIFLHNRGLGFNLDVSHDACLHPGRRPPHTLSPTLLTDLAGKRRGVAGTMGGDAQPQIVLQLLARLLHGGQSPEEALAAGRWILQGETAFSTWGGGRPHTALEAHAAEGWFSALAERGHDVRRLEETPLAGVAHLISIGADGTLSGASDPRVPAAAAVGV